jgi:hypothetical protein
MHRKIVAFAFAFAVALAVMPAGAARAQTTDIAALLAQIAALQAQLSGLQGGSSTGCYAFTADLTLGSSGAAVTALQNYLISTGHFSASVGATGYFGPITQSALAAWQAANGVSPASGYFGPISRAKYNSMCTPGSGDANDGDVSDEDLGGEADLTDFQALNDPDNEDVAEGDEEHAVFGFEFDVEDANAVVERVDVVFEGQDVAKSVEPWDYIEELTLWFDDEAVASVAADDEDDWDDDADDDADSLDDYQIRFKDFDVLVEEGTTPEFFVAVTLQSNIDSDDLDQEFDVWVPDDGLRAIDGEDITHEVGDDTETSTFSAEEVGADQELTVREGDDNPDATTVAVDEDNTSDEFMLLGFELEAEDADVDINELSATITIISASTTATSTYSDVVADIWLELDGDVFSDDTVGSAITTWNGTNPESEVSVTFDVDGDITIEDGDTILGGVFVEFKQQDGNYEEGDQISADVDSDEIDAEGPDDDLAAGQLSGSVTGEEHTLRISGAFLTADSDDFSVTSDENDDATTTDDEATFVIVFDVTAFEEDLFVEKTAERGAADGSPADGVNYIIETSDGTATTTGSVSAALSSTADTVSGFFKVNEGDTETFTLTVVLDPDLTAFYQLQLDSLNFATTAAVPTDEIDAEPAEDFETNSQNIDN